MNTTPPNAKLKPLSPGQIKEEARLATLRKARLSPLSELLGPPILALVMSGLFYFLSAMARAFWVLPVIGFVGFVWLIAALAYYFSKVPPRHVFEETAAAMAGALKGRCPHCRKDVVVVPGAPGEPVTCPKCSQSFTYS